jgi:hypothetical protein
MNGGKSICKKITCRKNYYASYILLFNVKINLNLKNYEIIQEPPLSDLCDESFDELCDELWKVSIVLL